MIYNASVIKNLQGTTLAHQFKVGFEASQVNLKIRKTAIIQHWLFVNELAKKYLIFNEHRHHFAVYFEAVGTKFGTFYPSTWFGRRGLALAFDPYYLAQKSTREYGYHTEIIPCRKRRNER